jgi:hypothetical protein
MLTWREPSPCLRRCRTGTWTECGRYCRLVATPWWMVRLPRRGALTPLMIAAAGGHEAVVEMLLRCGADPARRDTRGRSAAFYARTAGYPALAKRLDIVVDQEKTIW